jgi:phosphotriesterase-related protein
MKAQTVRGELPIEKLGMTLCHEHFLLDTMCWYIQVNDYRKGLADAPVSMENLGELRRDPLISKDNLVLKDPKLTIDEVMYFKQAGGSTIVDTSSIGIRVDIEAVRKISEATGINIIAGTGFYIESSHPKYVAKKTEEELAAMMVQEISEGIEETGIRCGIIGEIGISWPMQPNEKRVLKAAAHAQQKTGAAINVHPGMNRESPFDITRILKEEGANMEKVVISHIENRLPAVADLTKIAEMGCYTEFDTFGAEVYYDSLGRREATDFERVARIKELVRGGYGSRILLGHDTGWKTQLKKFGGYGYDHLLRHVIPMFKREGLDEDEIKAMFVENPKAVLGFIR